jgi:NitT/TauT family transport system substrate-binding protein
MKAWLPLLVRLVLVLPLLALAGCWASTPTLEVAIIGWPAYEYLYLAEQRQLGLRHGLKLKVRQFGSLQDQRLAYVRGDVDVLATTLQETIAICQEAPARCPVLVLVLDESHGGDVVLGAPGLRSMADLAGRSVGLEPTVLAQYLLLRGLQPHGLDLDDLRLVPGGPSELVEGLRGGRLAGIVSNVPHSIPLLAEKRFPRLFGSESLPGEVVDVLAADPIVLRRQPQRLRALVATWWEARGWADRHPGQAVALMAEREGLDPSAFTASEAGLTYRGPADQRRLLAVDGPVSASLQRIANLMVLAGRISPATPRPRPSTAALEGDG